MPSNPDAAVQRLDVALGRLEAVLTRLPADDGLSDAYEALQKRHARLETQTQAAFDRIERLLGRVSVD